MPMTAPALLARDAGGVAAPSLDLQVVSSTAELDALGPAWTRLHVESGASPFQSFEWQRTWWKYLGEQVPARRLHIVVLRAGGELVAIAPFMIESVRIAPLIKVRRLVFVGTGLSDQLEPIVRPGFEAAACELVAAHLAAGARAFDLLSLADIPEGSRLREPLLAALQRHGFEGKAFVAEQCPRTVLKSTWRETLDGWDGWRRRKLGWRIRQMQKSFKVEVELLLGGDGLAADVDEFIDMHQQRWTSAGKKGVYADPMVAAFQREIAQVFARRGWLLLAFLRVDGARMVSYFGFQQGDQVFVYLTGMRDLGEARKFAPGIVLHALCMESLLPQRLRRYEFLRGVEDYKYECGAVDVPNWALLFFRAGARSARVKNVVALLEESLARRADQEWTAFHHRRRALGLFSLGMARYLWRSARQTLRDGLTKLRAPEKSLSSWTARRSGRSARAR